MNDEKLIKVLKCFNDETDSERLRCGKYNTIEKMMIGASRNADISECKTKTDIYLNYLSGDDLNDLVSIVKVMNYDNFKRNDASWKRAKQGISFGDYPALRRHFLYKRMTDKECIKYLRGYSAETISHLIMEYLNMAPITKRQRDLIAQVYESRITGTNNKIIEVR